MRRYVIDSRDRGFKRGIRSRCPVLLVAVVASLPAGPLFAQSGRGALLEEITVTARKRAENSQDVGISMNVLDAALLESLNLDSLPEAAAYIPNVELFEDVAGAGIPTWVIRGVGLQDFNANNTPAAAVYLDEVYQTSTVMGAVGLFDVEQVEVLKGPQGGLYGRNTSGGAVLLNTRRAVLDERSGYARADYGRWRSASLEAAGNLPLADKAALRLAGRLAQSRDAWQASLADRRAHGEKDQWDLRAWLLYQPLDRLRIEWKAQGGRNDSEIPLGRAVGLYSRSGGFCQAVRQGMRDDAECLSFAGLNDLLAGRPVRPVSLQAEDGSLTLSDPLNRQSNDYFGNTLYVTRNFDALDLVSITSLDYFDYGVDLDLDASLGEYAHRFSSSDIEVLSQEFRLKSTSPSPLSWLVGLAFSEERFEEQREFLFADNFLVVNTLGAARGTLLYDQDTSSRALYGMADYALGGGWSLEATLRFTDEDKRYRDGDLFIPGEPPQYLASDINRDYSLDSRLAGKLGVEWEATEDWLWYASVSRGFKSGGFYGGFPINSPEEVNPYREETIIAYETGVKSDWPALKLRINGAVFYYDYRDVQSFIARRSELTGTLIDVLANPADARHRGADLSLSWRPGEALSLDLNLGYLDAVFTNARLPSTNILGDQVAIDGRRPYAPRWSGSAMLSYEQPFGGDYRFKGTLGYHYRSEFSGELSTPVERAVSRLPGYGLWDVRFDISSISNNWSVSLWGSNLLDESYLVRVKNDGLKGFADMFGEPRSIGASLEYVW